MSADVAAALPERFDPAGQDGAIFTMVETKSNTLRVAAKTGMSPPGNKRPGYYCTGVLGKSTGGVKEKNLECSA